MTGLGEPVYVEKNDAVAEMVDAAAKALPDDICTGMELAQCAIESLGIPLTVLAALRSGEWVALPKEATEEMVKRCVQVDLSTHHGIDFLETHRILVSAAPKEP